MSASAKGHVEMARELLNGGADANSRSEKNETALMWASRNGHVEVSKMLLDSGADVNAENSEGFTAYSFAVFGGHGAVKALLLSRGARSRARSWLPFRFTWVVRALLTRVGGWLSGALRLLPEPNL